MVRLKEIRRPPASRACCISIPYGSIKRYKEYIEKYYPNAFQFLMVRLKVCDTIAKGWGISPFQFLMVRLKDERRRTANLYFNEFQFLMVRLKVKFQTENGWRGTNFNSLWFD